MGAGYTSAVASDVPSQSPVRYKEATNGTSRLRVFLDYDLPSGWAYWLGVLFGGIYARWCVGKMLEGASNHFGVQRAAAAA